MKLLALKDVPIFKQLQLEEALLRKSQDEYCLINFGSPPAIVMGISQDKKLVVDDSKLSHNLVPVIRRFSGGGTVVIEPTTVFFTLIVSHNTLSVPPFPKDVLIWMEEVLRQAFKGLPFSLKENDFILNDKKCGGNAQYFTKGRVLHHTSFLWDYSEEYMNLLLHPPKMPMYRENRSHKEFLTTLRPYFPKQEDLVKELEVAIKARFGVEETSYEKLSKILEVPHRKSTCLVD